MATFIVVCQLFAGWMLALLLLVHCHNITEVLEVTLALGVNNTKVSIRAKTQLLQWFCFSKNTTIVD